MRQREHRKNLFRMFGKRKGDAVILLGMALSLVLFFGEIHVVYAEEQPNGSNLSEREIYVVDENGNYSLLEDRVDPAVTDAVTDGAQSGVESGALDEDQDETTDGTSEEGVAVQSADAGSEIEAQATGVKIVNFRAKSNGAAVAVNSTTDFKEKDTNYKGYTCGAYGADAIYLGMENGQVKFMLAGVIGLVNASEVQIVDYNSSRSVSYYYVKNGNLYHKVATNLNDKNAGSTINLGAAPSGLSQGVTYYSYDGHYFYTDYTVMASDYQNNTRSRSVNPSAPYYNYFQYLPFRSQTTYSAAELNQLIQSKTSSGKMLNMGNTAIKMQNTYGVNALAIVAIAGNESGWGKSNIAQNKNNLFGLNAIDRSPGASANSYGSVDACVKDFAETYMSKRYLRAGYIYYKGGFLGNKAAGINVSYGSDPYWGEKAASIMKSLDSAKRDLNQYTIGIKDFYNFNHTDLNVRKEASTSSAKIYSTGLQSGSAFRILGSSGDFYQIQSDPVLNSDRGSINTGSGNYSYDGMYGYVSKNYVNVVIQGKNPGNNGNDGDQDDGSLAVAYRAHCQTYGWMNYQKNGASAGTSGESKRMEALQIRLQNAPYSGDIVYQTHCQTYGWLSEVKNDAIAGTVGESKRVEAIRIKLTGEMAKHYDVYYRVHAQTFGWMGWAKNGESAGSAGYSKRLEAVQIVLIEKGSAAPGSTANAYRESTPSVAYQTHVQTYGWQAFVADGATAGTTGKSKRLESIVLKLQNKPMSGDIQYKTHVQTYGWQNWVSGGRQSGTTGKSKRLEAIQIKLTGDIANQYDIYYRVHAQTYGWLGWAKNGESAGTEGLSKRLEAIQVVLVKKGGAAPGNTANPFVKK